MTKEFLDDVESIQDEDDNPLLSLGDELTLDEKLSLCMNKVLSCEVSMKKG